MDIHMIIYLMVYESCTSEPDYGVSELFKKAQLLL